MELINNDLVGFDSITLQNQMRNININVSDMSVQTETRKFADKCNYSKETRDIAVSKFSIRSKIIKYFSYPFYIRFKHLIL